jgi:hypothetical protein
MTQGKCRAVVLSSAVLLFLSALPGCGGGGGGPSGPQLGAEVDLSLYQPASLHNYSVTYRSTTDRDTVEANTWYVGTETVFDYDPDTGEDTEVECDVIQEEADNIFQDLGDMRTYADDKYAYGIKIYGEGTWEPLYYLRPKLKIAPDENPRINGVFDSGGASVTFAYEDVGYRVVFWLRNYTTYLAIEDSVTVPAGTFYDVLKTRDRQRSAVKVTALNDTSDVFPGYPQLMESETLSWHAPGIGLIRSTYQMDTGLAERVMISGTIDGVTYPVVKGNQDVAGHRSPAAFLKPAARWESSPRWWMAARSSGH